jgi:hypothetical protein
MTKVSKLTKTSKLMKTLIVDNLPGNRDSSKYMSPLLTSAIGVSACDETISQFWEARPEMTDFDLSERSSPNMTRELAGRRWVPIQKSSTPLNALKTALLNHLQNERGQDRISAPIPDCGATDAAAISKTQER